MTIPVQHIPVLLDEVQDLFSKIAISRFLDGTVGLGGHASMILSSHPEITEYCALDQDIEALEAAKENLRAFSEKVHFSHQNFADVVSIIPSFQGILLDVGVSSLQIDRAERGFSFMREGPLDMRMDIRGETTAADIVNSWNSKDLANLFFTLGEERGGRKVADAICQARHKHPFSTTKELADLIENVLGRRGPIHPATKIFQALRIEVNEELKVLQKALPLLAQKLAPGGVFVCISFHSGEDRLVKQAFLPLVQSKEFEFVVKKPLMAQSSECRKNPRSRSAKLRAICRKSYKEE
jgi:16S rRNA (cytosine1402-N4)-methyltransferase